MILPACPEVPCLAPVQTLDCEESIRRYIRLRCAEGMTQEGDTYRHIDLHLGRFAASHGGIALIDLTTEHIRAWVAALPYEPVTIRHHLISVKVWLKRAQQEGWIARDPSCAVKPPIVEEQDVWVMPVKQAWSFFRSNRDARCVGRLALEAFGGLRYSSAAQITAEEIRWQEQGLEMPSNKHKSRRRKYRQGQPDNCWAWLRHAPASCWQLTKRQYAAEKLESWVVAGLRPLVLKSDADQEQVKRLRNVWRHSFASYLLARLRAYGPVAYLMQHSSESTTQIYEGMASGHDSALYFGITPATVLLSWDEFVSTLAPAPTTATATTPAHEIAP